MPITTKSSKNRVLPPLGAAVICEKLLMEPDNVPSAIRIVDTVQLPSATMPPQGTLTALNLTMMVIFKKGDAEGDMKLMLHQIDPSEKREALGDPAPINFSGPPEGGLTIRIPVHLKWDKDGLYWFEISLDETIVARVPLKVIVVKTEALPDAPGA